MDITKVVQIVREAGELALHYEGGSSKMNQKSDNTIVTEGDKLVGELITRRIQEFYPDHLVVQEENFDPKVHTPERLSQGYVWILDPIDGTRAFRAKLLDWHILLGLLHNGKPVEGIDFFPHLGEIYYTNGEQVFYNEMSISCTMAYDYERPLSIGISPDVHKRFDLRALQEFPGRIISFLSAKYAMNLFIRAICSAVFLTYQFTSYIWDIAALVPIIEKAGGELRYPSGKPFQISDFFDLSQKTKRDILICRQGEFEQFIKYFVPRS